MSFRSDTRENHLNAMGAESNMDYIAQFRPPMETANSSANLFGRGPENMLAVEEVPSTKNAMTTYNPPKNMWRIVALLIWSFGGGFSDAAPGALLPHMEAYYGTNYSVTSLIWISNAVGFIFIACISHLVQKHLGKRYSLTVGCVSGCIMYAIVGTGTKFPVIVMAFLFGGIGSAIVLAQGNVFLSRLEKQSKFLAYNHACYGVGATVSPLIATSIVNAGVAWHYFYFVLLGIMVCNGINLFFAFAGADEDLKPWDVDEAELLILPDNDIEMDQMNTSRSRRPSTATEGFKKNELMLALHNKVTWLLAFFLLFYQGSEVSMAGWIVTFMLEYRGGNPKYVGYVASGYWGGLTIGRLVLTRPLHKTIGSRKGVTVVSLLAILFVGLTWAIPHIVVEGVLISIAGILIGPNYPLMITAAALDGLIPRKIQVVSLSIITAFGSSGGALFPFLVGIISESAGTFVVLPIFIGLYSLMLVLWIWLPNMDRRKKQPKGEYTFWERIW